jgi:hypothetical protein
METKTHWKKNLDSRYISGEDLIGSLNGLKPEMVVQIEKFNDDKTFDKNKAADVQVSALYLKDVTTSKPLYKPVILNKTNARFFEKATGSAFINDWIDIPVTMYAQKDSRHGHVVRFKPYVKPVLLKDTENFTKVKTALANGYTMEQVKQRYNVSAEVEALLTNG